MAQWTADIDVPVALAARLIASQFPVLAGASVEVFGGGWDNAAFLVDERLVFRFPRRRAAAGLIEREVAILPPIAPRLPLAISAPACIGRKTDEYPWIFAGYERIGGWTSCSVVLSEDARAALASPLATFLRALHVVDPAPSIARGKAAACLRTGSPRIRRRECTMRRAGSCMATCTRVTCWSMNGVDRRA